MLILASLPWLVSHTIATKPKVVNVVPPVPLNKRARAIIVENLSVLALFQVRGVGEGGAVSIDLETGIMEQ